MYDRIIGGCILIALSIVLLAEPWQLFARNGPEMVRQVNSKPIYKNSLKVLGIILLILGITIECSIYL